MTKSTDLVPVGRIAGLWRYPVKSMKGEAIREARVSWDGVVGDRRWAFVRENVVRSGFPWLTLRQRNDMNRYAPSFTDNDDPDKSETLVKTPSGDVFDVTDTALASELWPKGVRVIRQNRGVFDTFPLSLITTQTIAQLGEICGEPLVVERFRPNILVDATGDSPFPEDEWVGHVLRFGDIRMRVDKRDGRCVVITIDPVTAERNPSILRAVTDQRQGCLGVYGTTVEPGSVTIDDTVYLEPSA